MEPAQFPIDDRITRCEQVFGPYVDQLRVMIENDLNDATKHLKSISIGLQCSQIVGLWYFI